MVSSGLLRRVALVRATRRNNPEDTILHSHRRENLKSYKVSSNQQTEAHIFVDSFHPDDGGDTILRIVGSYKSHKSSHPRRCQS
jgi:hypothetical protein